MGHGWRRDGFLMMALAGRKAKTNAVGVVGLVENMPMETLNVPETWSPL